MANKSLFASLTNRLPRANAVNEAGGLAYKLEPKHALAQVAATGTFGNAFYSTAETQLDEVLKLIDEVDDNQYLAKLALYAREKAFMKDMPAALLVSLSVRDTELMHRVFDRVVDNGRVITSAGVSAGIDMSFHVVAKLLSPEIAAETARQTSTERPFHLPWLSASMKPAVPMPTPQFRVPRDLTASRSLPA